MKNTKDILIAAAMTGALASFPLTSHADFSSSAAGSQAEKMGCSGKDGCSSKDGDKESCQGKDKHGKKKSGDKAGCGSKRKQGQ